MYCSFCGKEVRSGDIFCSSCGKNLVTGQMSQNTTIPEEESAFLSNKKVIISIVAIISIVITLSVIVILVSSPSIVGVWMDGTDKVTFTSSGDYKADENYGTYTIWSDKTLEIEFGEYSFSSGHRTYRWGVEAKEDSEYWYISGRKLYFRGREYTKK